MADSLFAVFNVEKVRELVGAYPDREVAESWARMLAKDFGQRYEVVPYLRDESAATIPIEPNGTPGSAHLFKLDPVKRDVVRKYPKRKRESNGTV